MRKVPFPPAGAVHQLSFDSKVLVGNFLGDPTDRRIDVYVPADHDGAGLPLLVDLIGFTAGGPAHTNWKNFTENVPERLDRLIATGTMPPCVAALPDCFTKLGGNQYINSAAVGPWADFLLEEAIPFVETRFGCGGSGRRAVFGKSSGGYGSIAHALLYPDFWAGAACHSGDMGFELAYLVHMPATLRAIAKEGNSPGTWIDAFYAKEKVKDEEIHILMSLAMCATYDPDLTQPYGVRLPVDVDTCELIAERWKNYEAWDPVNMAQTRGEGLKKLKALWIDCGDADQIDLLYGARRLTRLLTRLGVDHTYEEFPDNHTAIDYRMDRSLPFLANALAT